VEQYDPKDPNYKIKIEESFNRQEVMKTINASLAKIEPGKVSINLKYSTKITQQHGFVHAGIVSTVIDSACGYAALTLMPEDTGVLSIEFKVNLLAPAKGDFFVASGFVRKPGKTIMVTEGELIAYEGNEEKLIATMVATMMCVADRNNIKS
jgi:uncharacterized protein (TIGR00369 family)